MNRFSRHQETIIDTRTGLVWTQSGSVSDFPMTWPEAFDFIKALNQSGFCGHRHWKLPNRKELLSLMSHEMINPSLPRNHPFTDVFTGYYWTATTCARLPDQAWYIHLGGAKVYRGLKDHSYMVWPVLLPEAQTTPVLKTGQRTCYDIKGRRRPCETTGQDGEFQSGYAGHSPRFTEAKGLVHDRDTGLTWSKDAGLSHQMLDWASAFDAIDRLNSDRKYGCSDWRLPTIFELESLTDMGRHTPALPGGHPFTDVREFYWSSTTSQYNTDYAWALYMVDGGAGVGYKALAEFYLWPVRGKPSIQLD